MMKNILVVITLFTVSIISTEAFGQVSIGKASPATSNQSSNEFRRGVVSGGNGSVTTTPMEVNEAPAATSIPPNAAGQLRHASAPVNPDAVIDPTPGSVKVFQSLEEMNAYYKENNIKPVRKKIDEQDGE